MNVLQNVTCIYHDFDATVVSRNLGDNIVTVYKQHFTYLFEDFRRCEIFALLPNHCRYRYTYQKLSHNEGDISTRVLPLSVNFFLYINMGTARQLLDQIRYSKWLRNCIIVYCRCHGPGVLLARSYSCQSWPAPTPGP